jgi:DNA-binding MarR family transcriptional regulator
MRRGSTALLVTDRVFGRPGEPQHVEPNHLDVLDLLTRRDGRRMSELAAALHVDPSTITRTMHRMEAAGLAQRASVAADGRLVTAHLTEEGRRVHGLVAGRRAELIAAGLAGLSSDEQERLVDLLERFLRSLGAYVRTPNPASTAAG